MKISSSMMSSSVVCHDASAVIEKLAPVGYAQAQYLLKDGSVSSHPVYNQEKGVFVNSSLVMDLHISQSPMTAQMAKLFYKLVDKPAPSLFQVLLLQMNYEAVAKRLADIGMSGAVSPYPLENVWYDEVLEKAKPDESRFVITFQPYENYYEPMCDCLAVLHEGKCAGEDTVRQFLIDRKVLLEQKKGEFHSGKFVLQGTWNNFDLLTFSPCNKPLAQWLFFRNRNTLELCHYIIADTSESVEILSDELYEYDNAVYQALGGKIVKIHLLGARDYVGFDSGKLHIGHDVACCGDMLPEYENISYAKGDDGLYTKRDN